MGRSAFLFPGSFGGGASTFTKTGTAGFLPTDIPDLGLWLDADDAASLTISDTNKVDAWADRRANGLSYSQSTGVWRPSFFASTEDGDSVFKGPIVEVRSTWFLTGNAAVDDLTKDIPGWTMLVTGVKRNVATLAYDRHVWFSDGFSAANVRVSLATDAANKFKTVIRTDDQLAGSALTETTVSYLTAGFLTSARADLNDQRIDLFEHGNANGSVTGYANPLIGSTENTSSLDTSIGGQTPNAVGSFEAREILFYTRPLLAIERRLAEVYMAKESGEQVNDSIQQYITVGGDSIAIGGWHTLFYADSEEPTDMFINNQAVSGYTIGLTSYPGTVSTTSGSAIITGVGTNFLDTMFNLTTVEITDGDTLIIQNVDSDTQITCTTNASTTVSGKTITRNLCMEKVAADPTTGADNLVYSTIAPQSKQVHIIFGGTNNINLHMGNYVSPDTDVVAASAYAELRDYVQTRIATGVYEGLIVVTSIPREGPNVNTALEKYNNLIVNNWATELAVDGATHRVDLHTVTGIFDDFTDDAGSEDNATYYTDGVHPTTAGQQIIANEIGAVINSMQTSAYKGAALVDPVPSKGMVARFEVDGGCVIDTVTTNTIETGYNLANRSHNFDQSTKSLQPVYTQGTSGINSLPTALFDGVDDTMIIPYDATLMGGMVNAFTIAMVVQSVNPQAGTARQLIGKYSIGDVRGFFVEQIQNLTGPHANNWRIKTYTGTNETATFTGDPFDNTTHVIIIRVDNGNISAWLDNGSEQTATYTHNSGFTDTEPLCICNTTGRYWGGHLPDTLVWGEALTNAQVTDVRDYLVDKAGI